LPSQLVFSGIGGKKIITMAMAQVGCDHYAIQTQAGGNNVSQAQDENVICVVVALVAEAR
jgi:hypothetical protein